jgi:hypothetical protein
MWFFMFVTGGMIGFSTCAIFSVNAYNKGYKDGVKEHEA